MLSFLLMSFNRAEATLWISEPPIKIGVLKTEHLDETTAAQAILLDKLSEKNFSLGLSVSLTTTGMD